MQQQGKLLKSSQIVTGAPNIKEGDIVPIAKDGSTLPGGVEIKTGHLRGVDSCGMMCSIGELGLDIHNYPNQIENGIMILDKEQEKKFMLQICCKSSKKCKGWAIARMDDKKVKQLWYEKY